jgi:hypothetical protein
MVRNMKQQDRNYYSAFDDDEERSITADEVIEPIQDDWIATGLLNINGKQIMRRRNKIKFGFDI